MNRKEILAGLLAAVALGACTNKTDKAAAAADAAVTETPAAAADIVGYWYIDNIVLGDSLSVRPAEQAPMRAYIIFTDSTYSIMTNCNAFNGSYSLKGDSLRMGDGAMTEIACDNMVTEDAVRRILPQIATVKVENDSVIRLDSPEHSQYMTLIKAPKIK